MRSRTDDTLRYVQFLARRFDKQDIKAVILVILLELGMSPSLDGFRYLRRALEINFADTTGINAKGVYLSVGNALNAYLTDQGVEQNIRYTIRAAWKNRDKEIWRYFFPESQGKRPKCPSNKEFISEMTCILELWQSCKEAGYERI